MHVAFLNLNRRNMLALPVERLVGNNKKDLHNDHHHHHHHHSSSSRMSLSPDSIVSESSSTISNNSSMGGESQLVDSPNQINRGDKSPIFSSPSHSPPNCKMHVLMKTKSADSVLISPTSTPPSPPLSTGSGGGRADNNDCCPSPTSNRNSYYLHHRHNNLNNNNNSRRSQSPQQQKNEDERELARTGDVVIKSEIDIEIDYSKSIHTKDCTDERLRNKRLSPLPPPPLLSKPQQKDLTIEEEEDKMRERMSMSANRIQQQTQINERRVNNNNNNAKAKAVEVTFIKSNNNPSGDHRDRVCQEADDDDDEINIEVDEDEEDPRNSKVVTTEGKRNNLIGDNYQYNSHYDHRPPSRPLSTSSSISTTSSQSNFKPYHHHPFSIGHHSHLHPHFSPAFGSINGNNGHNNSSNNNNHSHFLKFSIEDILRPDFGINLSTSNSNKNNIRNHPQQIFNPFLISPPSSSSSSSSNTINHKLLLSPSSSLNLKPRNGSVSSTDGHRPYRPSSVNCHSEDSNGSCKSRAREPEVVDDTKVNPPVPKGPLLWPAWVYCTRYSDRPSSGPRSRRIRKEPREVPEEKRPRTAFTAEQLARLKKEFEENRYLTEKRRQDLAQELKLHENQIKIWFQNKRAKLKKSTGTKNGLAMQLMAQGLYNHSTVPIDEDEEMEMMMM